MSVPLEIYLLRANGSDDCIEIKPVVDAYKISYTDKRVNNVSHFFYANEHETVTYLEDLFDLLVVDRDPFTFIQFSFPCFPAVMYSIEELKNLSTRRTIIDRFSSTIRNWPERFRSFSRGVY